MILQNVDNTSDADKPVSTAQQTALDLKADASAVSNVDNTSDADKPVSTAQSAAIYDAGRKTVYITSGGAGDNSGDSWANAKPSTFLSTDFEDGGAYDLLIETNNYGSITIDFHSGDFRVFFYGGGPTGTQVTVGAD